MRTLGPALALSLALLLPARAQEGEAVAALRGRVLDAQTGEPIAKALVSVLERKRETTTDARGRFELPDLALGSVSIAVTTVGYGVVRKSARVAPGEPDLEIWLGQDAFKRTEEVTVESPVFEPADRSAPAEHSLGGVELKNLASVLADDPLRSVQSLPGVATGDDFNASFAARGSGFSSVGFYVDGVLMNAPFHTIRDVNDGFTLTILNGDVVEALSLLGGGAPARYGDRIGAVLNVRTREGSREEFFGRASLGATGLYATLEGPLGASRKTSWLVSGRKSYLDYVLSRVSNDAGIVLGYYDGTAKLTHHPSAAQTLSLLLIHGRSRWRSTEGDLRPQDMLTADAHTGLSTLEWRYLPSARFWLETGAFVSRETGRNRSLDGTDRFRSAATQWGFRSDLTRSSGRHRIEAGLLLRHRADAVVARDFDSQLRSYRVDDNYAAGSAQWGAHVQNTWSALRERLALTLGARFDGLEETRESHLLPRGAFSFALSQRLKLIAAAGSYSQFPAFLQLHGSNGNPDLDAERSRHLTVGLERQLGGKLRVRMEAYEQREEGLLFIREAEWRTEGGAIVPRRPDASPQNALSGRSRGLELMLQRRSANGLSGWIAYGLSHARRSDTRSGQGFDSDYDQTHTLTVYGSYRVSQRLNVSTKYRYGSGFPVAGFYEERAGGVFLSSARNTLRSPAYSRWDVRANKAFVFPRIKLTLYGEVINLLNRTHYRYTGLDGVNIRTGRVALENETLFPILPSVGVTVEF